MSEPFVVKDCSLIVLSTGRQARTLWEFSSHLQAVPLSSIYHHFWGSRLQPLFDEPEFQNDFASWARHGLHDPLLSEQLAVLDPTDFVNLEDLRRETVEIVEQRLAADDYASWIQAQYPFAFVHSQIVIFDTPLLVKKPSDLAAVAPALPLGSVFFHFIDARRRPEIGMDDFRTWLLKYWPGHDGLVQALARVEPYFCTLAELRERLARTISDYFHKRTDEGFAGSV
jgi:hypothetical protein